MEEESFLRAIADAPEDDVPRLVYADWLEERGDDTRADCLRLECDGVRLPSPAELRCRWGKELPPVEARYPPVLLRLSEKARDIDPGWLASVSRLGLEIRRLVARFLAAVPGSLTGAARPAPEAAACWQEARGDVRRMFEGHLAECVSRERFTVPVDYALFTAITGAGLRCPDEYGMTYFDALFGAEEMAQQTVEFCELYAAKHRGKGELLVGCGLWLFVGYRDKHDLHLGCDLASPLFGAVVDQHDSHPWLSPPHGPVPWEVMTRSFLDYLRWQVAEAEREGEMREG
jgi:uncharacterized protein (TIGR02996 family)